MHIRVGVRRVRIIYIWWALLLLLRLSLGLPLRHGLLVTVVLGLRLELRLRRSVLLRKCLRMRLRL